MERFSKDLELTSSEVADLLAVHASTVKRWCNEGEIPSEKTSGGHRRVHLEDALAFARERGIVTVLSPFHPYEPHVWTALHEVRREGSFRRLHNLAMGWSVRGQMRRLTARFDALARDPEVPLCRFCDEGVRGLMARVGQAWAEGRLRVAEEHMVSQAMTEVLLKLRADQRDTKDREGWSDAPPVAVVGSVEGNQHHLGSLSVRLLLERLGWDVFYLGPDVPVEDFAVVQRGREASLVCVSLPPMAQAGDVARAVRVLSEFYDPDHPYSLALGGSVSQEMDPALLRGPFLDLRTFASCDSLRQALEAGFASTPAGAL
ncbi:MAG: helix-turn-helix domain-containing protein [Gemmatimonadetes bacterium]|nr:helix-turn-helix domain-containing protein [Gemmatimonadota bacterium]